MYPNKLEAFVSPVRARGNQFAPSNIRTLPQGGIRRDTDMKSLICVMLAGVMLGGATIGVSEAAADDRKGGKHRYSRHDDRDDDWDDDRDHDRRDRRRRYFSDREVILVRDYYRPRYRHEGRGHYKYYRSGYLPRGWHRRMRPYPVYVEREVVVLPRGYRRGIIDGHAVVYNSRGLIIDVAVLF